MYLALNRIRRSSHLAARHPRLRQKRPCALAANLVILLLDLHQLLPQLRRDLPLVLLLLNLLQPVGELLPLLHERRAQLRRVLDPAFGLGQVRLQRPLRLLGRGRGPESEELVVEVGVAVAARARRERVSCGHVGVRGFGVGRCHVGAGGGPNPLRELPVALRRWS